MTRIRNPFRLDDDHPFTGWHMLGVVFAFFGTIIAVNLVMAFLAAGTFPGLVVKNSYVASQNYNALLAETRAHEATGWRMALAAPGGTIVVGLADRDGRPVRGLDVTVAAGRPSTMQEDRVLTLAEGEDGYRALAALAPGLWEVAVEAREGGVLVYAGRERIHVAGEAG
jgi:nitrogen fixation protein FixH